ncbi:hypothetical protein RRG08_025545, partial [Elysia crispata]
DDDAHEAELGLDLDLSSESEDEETSPIPTQTDLQPVPSDESTDDPSEDHNIIEDLSLRRVSTAGSVPTASTCVTVLGLLHVIKSMVPVAQAVTRTGLDLPVNMERL